MKNNNFNLVILHHEEVFETRELALNYLTDYYKPSSIDAEPVIVKYGEERNPNVILAFGTSDNAPGSYYAIDMAKANEQIEDLIETVDSDKEELEYIADVLSGVVKSTGLTLDENKIEDKISYDPDPRDNVIGTAVSIAEAVDLLSKYAQSNDLSVEDTKSVRLIYEVNPSGGKTLKAEINVSTEDSDDVNFNNNIIGIKNDGIYAASHLAYDDVRHELIFTTSGYKNGNFQDDAIVQKVNLGQHTKLIADNEGNSVKLVIVEDPENYTATLSANLQIAERENNILKVTDGKAYVEGIARNIKYGDTTVAAALPEHTNKLNELDTEVENAAKTAHVEGGQTDTFETLVSTLADGGAKVTGNVRLGSQNSIVVRNGGLEANITVDVDTASNKLIVTIGEQTITKQLPGVELFQSAEYNDENEELIITFRTGNTLVIPIHGIIHTWDTSNAESSPITLTKTVVTGGVDTLSGNIKLRSTDNLIGIENGKLYVSEQTVDNKVNTETSRATGAETEIRTSIQNLTNTVNSQFDDVSDRITEVSDDLAAETTNRTNKDTELDGKITNLTQSIANEQQRAETAEEALEASLSQAISNEQQRAKTAEETLDTKVDTLETNLISRINHEVSDVQHLIQDETTRATSAEAANAARIEEVAASISEGSEQAVEEAKLYTDTKVLAEKTAREAKELQIENSIVTAVRDASDDATAKANAAETNAKAYTDTKVAAEQTRAEAAEQALSTQVARKIENVEIIKNSQSDLQYTLRVDGQDAGEINIPKDQFLRSVTYDPSTKQMTFVFETTEGTSTTIVDVSNLVDTYTNGNGLDLNNNVFSVKIDSENTEPYIAVTSGGVKVYGINAALAEKANVSDVNAINSQIDTINGNEAVEGSIKNALKEAKEYADTKSSTITDNVYTKAEADAKYLTQESLSDYATVSSVETLATSVNANTQSLATLNGNEAVDGSVKNAIKVSKEYTDEKVAAKANSADVYTKTEIDNKGYLTEHQDISNLATKASLQATDDKATQNTGDIATLTTRVDNMEFIAGDTDTVSMQKVVGNNVTTLVSNVRIKDMSGGQSTNIIKSDSNGIFATVNLTYNTPTNTLTFTDTNGSKDIKLTGASLVEGADYDNVNKLIILHIKTGDVSSDVTIPVGDLVDTWNVRHINGSPIVLTKTSGQDGDILTGELSISGHAKNLITVDGNGGLLADGDSNAHFALWGSTEMSVQAALNQIYGQIGDFDFQTLQTQVGLNTQNITNIQGDVNNLESDLSDLEARLEVAEQNALDAKDKVDELDQQLGDISGEKTVAERLGEIETTLTELIDFGEY
jgi:hypothetical protein